MCGEGKRRNSFSRLTPDPTPLRASGKGGFRYNSRVAKIDKRSNADIELPFVDGEMDSFELLSVFRRRCRHVAEHARSAKPARTGWFHRRRLRTRIVWRAGFAST